MGSGEDNFPKNTLEIPFSDEDSALDAYRKIMANDVARARILRMRVEKNILIIRSKLGNVGELAIIAEVIENAKKKSL